MPKVLEIIHVSIFKVLHVYKYYLLSARLEKVSYSIQIYIDPYILSMRYFSLNTISSSISLWNDRALGNAFLINALYSL